MKYFIIVFLLFFAPSAHAQITLEHIYSNTNTFGLVEVDSGDWKYINFNQKDSIKLFNLDHSIDRVILVPVLPTGATWNLAVIARQLFNIDSEYSYLLTASGGQKGHVRIFKEDGSTIFACDSCDFGLEANDNPDWVFAGGYSLSILNTSNGSKMFITSFINPASLLFEVYSLPGKLPSCQSTLAGVNPPTSYIDPAFPTSAYPNPSNGQVRIAYTLPSGVSSGDLILTTEDGREVKRYHVTSAFSDLLIEASDLPSGSYFYKLVTEKGESVAQRIVMMK
jgi:hypothetical protein